MENIVNPYFLDIVNRLFLAVVLGMVIGTERIIAHKTAGMRTYSFVALGASLFTVVGTLLSLEYKDSSFNGAHIPAAIITGIGFLGAGLMFWKDAKHPIGITSAAALWVCAGIGVACGYGYFSLAIITTILVLFVFIVLWFIEQRIKKIVENIQI